MPQNDVDHKHHRQRLKERFLQEGLDSFDPVNILELMLFYAIPQGDTNPTAHRLLDTFGSLSGVMNASVENLCQVKGVGQHAATLIKLFAAVVRPYLDDANRGGVVLQSTDEICRYLLPKFAGRTVETFYLVCLDGRRRVNYCGILSEGTLDSVPGVCAADRGKGAGGARQLCDHGAQPPIRVRPAVPGGHRYHPGSDSGAGAAVGFGGGPHCRIRRGLCFLPGFRLPEPVTKRKCPCTARACVI